jgi:hypothetical protein
LFVEEALGATVRRLTPLSFAQAAADVPKQFVPGIILFIYTLELMKTTTLILFFALLSTQVFAQKEAQEFPWSKAAKIISADEAKSRNGKKTGQQSQADSKKTEKKIDAENKRSDRNYSATSGIVGDGK